MTKARDTADINSGTNTAAGEDALENNTASNNTAVGYQAGLNVTTGTLNTLVGSGAGGSATMTGSENNLLGYIAGRNITSGQYNTGIGSYSINSLTTGSGNIAMGRSSLGSTTTGNSNVAVGFDALQANTNAFNNTALGYRAGYLNTTGTNNTFIGTNAGYANTTAFANTFIGDGSGDLVTTGYRNTILGMFDGNQGGLDIRTSNNNIVLSDGSGNPRVVVKSSGNTHLANTSMNIDNSGNTATGLSVASTGTTHIATGGNNTSLLIQRVSDTGTDNAIYFLYGTTGVGSVTVNSSSTAYNTSSDYRLKENVDYTWDATTRLKQLKPARFNFISDADTTVDGFLAHEAQAVVPECVTGTKDAVDDDGNAVMQGIDQSKLVPLLVKTIQELEARITALEA